MENGWGKLLLCGLVALLLVALSILIYCLCIPQKETGEGILVRQQTERMGWELAG